MTPYALAKSKGEKYYVTGKQCKRGHFSKRLISTSVCYGCALSASLQWKKDNPEKRGRYYTSNRLRIATYGKAYRQNNKAREAARAAKHRACKLQATPQWADQDAISELYHLREWVSALYQEQFEVDHIIPLRGKNVCGLHVADNLRIVDMKTNRIKSNKFIGDSVEQSTN